MSQAQSINECDLCIEKLQKLRSELESLPLSNLSVVADFMSHQTKELRRRLIDIDHTSVAWKERNESLDQRAKNLNDIRTGLDTIASLQQAESTRLQQWTLSIERERRALEEQDAADRNDKLTALQQQLGEFMSQQARFNIHQESLTGVTTTLEETKTKLITSQEETMAELRNAAAASERATSSDKATRCAEARAAAAEAKATAAEARTTAAEARATEAEEKLADREGLQAAAGSKLIEAQTKLAEADAMLADTEKKLAETVKSAAELNERISTMEREMAEALKLATESKNRLADAEGKVVAAEKKLGDIGIQLTDTEKKLAEAKRKIADGEEKLADSEKRLVDGEKKLVDSEKKLAKAATKLVEFDIKLVDAAKMATESNARVTAAEAKSADTIRQLEVARETIQNTVRYSTPAEPPTPDDSGPATKRPRLDSGSYVKPVTWQDLCNEVNSTMAGFTPSHPKTTDPYDAKSIFDQIFNNWAEASENYRTYSQDFAASHRGEWHCLKQICGHGIENIYSIELSENCTTCVDRDCFRIRNTKLRTLFRLIKPPLPKM